MMKRCCLIMICLSLLFLAGCKSSRQQVDTSMGMGYDRSLNEHFDSLVAGYVDWENVNVPIKFELKSPKHLSVSGRVMMSRGENIMVSLRFLGMEVANLYITTDSIYATDKVHKYYISEGIGVLQGKLPVTINELQDMLLGQAFILDGGRLNKSMKRKIDMHTSDNGWLITPDKKYGGIGHILKFSAEDRLTVLTVSKNEKKLLECSYSGHTNTPAGVVANRSNILINALKTPLQADIIWTMDKAKWNTDNLREWREPKGYKRISGGALLKVLSEM